MFKPEVDSTLVKKEDSIKHVMRVIDRGGIGTAFVINEKSILIGSVTDGDIRQAILKGADINSKISSVMNVDPVFLYEDSLSRTHIVFEAVSKLLNRSEANLYMPVVNKDKVLIKLILCSKLIKFEKGNSLKNSLPKSILIVGGAGYLGSILCRKLIKAGYKVRVLDLLLFGKESLKELLSHPSFELVEGDMRNITTVVSALKGINAVVNLAAIVGDPACQKYPESAIETNYLANKLLAEACKYHQINRFVYASTCSVYGIGNGKLDENSALNPVSLYARSKIKSEEAILSLMDENFSPCILRMSTLYGLSPRMRFDLVVNTMTMKAVTEGKITVFGGKQFRPLLHTSDAADAYIKCLKAPIDKIKGQIFNVGSDDQNYRISEIGKKVKSIVKDAELIINEDSSDPRYYLVSFKKINKQLGFATNVTIPFAVKEIKKTLDSGLIKDVKQPRYYNVGEN